jgi:large subunit ribosomal protein L23
MTERSVKLSYGDPHVKDDKLLVRKYTFIVAKSATKIEIKQAIENLYNAGKKKGDKIVVDKVNTITMHGKSKRVRTRRGMVPTVGRTSDKKKAIITLAKGHMLEDYGV